MRFALWSPIPLLLRLVGITQPSRQQLPPREHARTPGPASPRPLAQKRPEPVLRMAVEVLETWKGPIVRLRGEAGVPEASALEAAVMRLVARRPGCVTFDLSELGFISSLAMGVLVTYRRAAVHAGTQVGLAPELSPAVREALDRVGLLDLFEVIDGAKACAEPGAVAEDSRTLFPKGNDSQRTDGVNWAQLVELEPQVQELLWRARVAGATCWTSLDVERAFGPVKNELAGPIGFAGKHHRHPVLGSVGAYEAAYRKLYDAVAALLPARAAGAQETREKQGRDTVAEKYSPESAATATARA